LSLQRFELRNTQPLFGRYTGKQLPVYWWAHTRTIFSASHREEPEEGRINFLRIIRNYKPNYNLVIFLQIFNIQVQVGFFKNPPFHKQRAVTKHFVLRKRAGKKSAAFSRQTAKSFVLFSTKYRLFQNFVFFTFK
jgi:hypothetical protein